VLAVHWRRCMADSPFHVSHRIRSSRPPWLHGEQYTRAQDILQVLRSCSAIMDALNPVRNRATVAHPNAELLQKEEAMLVINVARTLLHYLDAKLS
jgi:Abortive infection C-terminus